jgi:hypothetical protein
MAMPKIIQAKQIELKLDAAEQAEAFLKDHPATQARFDQVAKLIDGFETPFGLELLATVHWIRQQENAADVSDAVAKVYRWNDRKRMFKESTDSACVGVAQS